MVLVFIVLVAILLVAMPAAKGIALFIAGLVASGLSQLFKGNLSGRMALTLNVVLSAVLQLLLVISLATFTTGRSW